MINRLTTFIYERRKLFLAVSAGLFALSLVLVWWNFVFATPERVLSAMLSNNLKTPGIVRSIHQGEQGGSIDQQIYLSFIDQPRAQTLTTLKQQAPEGGSSQVITENIGTIDTDFIRYRELSVGEQGGPADTSAAENQWAKREAAEGPASQASFLSEGLFGLVVFGNFDEATSGKLMAQMAEDDVYSYSSVNKRLEGGRYIYAYQMEILPSSLVGLLSQYANMLDVEVGNELDPENYLGAPPVEATFKVDALTRQLRAIEHDESARTESFSSWGMKRPIDLPTETITIDELQNRLQSIE